MHLLQKSSLLRSRFLGCHAMLHPKKRLLTTEPHSFPFVFLVCLHFVEQTNHIIAKCEWCAISRVKASGFCFTPHARHQNWAVFAGYDHDRGKKIWMKAPRTKASCAHCCTFGSWGNIYDFLEMSNCKRQSESFLQIENRIAATFRTRCQQIKRATWFISPFLGQIKIYIFLLHNDFSSWKLQLQTKLIQASSVFFGVLKQRPEIRMLICDVSDDGIQR